jgi:hypothetical protein
MVGPLVGVDGAGSTGTLGTPFFGAFSLVLGFTGVDSGALA